MANQIKNVALVGTGVIGASWAALYLTCGPGAKRGVQASANASSPGKT